MTNQNNVMNEIADILSKILKRSISSSQLSEETNLFTDMGVDSITIMDFVIELETRFKTMFDEEVLTAELFERLGNLTKHLNRQSVASLG